MRVFVGFMGLMFGLLACSSSLSVAADDVNVPAEPKDMKVIFNGKDLTGWDGDPQLWSVREGAIRGETTSEKKAQGNTFLVWKEGQTKNFDLRLTFRVGDANNSGIQYRSKHFDNPTAKNRWVVKGYQHEIRNSPTVPNVSGFIYDEGGKRGRMCMVGEKAVWTAEGKKVLGTVITAEEFAKLFRPNEWNDVAIIAKGSNIKHYLNGRLILDFTDEEPNLALKDGILALQIHAGAPMWVEFKNIRIKSLD